MDFPIGSVITLLVFLIGVPAIVLQFMAGDVRHVVMENLIVPREIFLSIGFAVVVMGLAGYLVRFFPSDENIVWDPMLFILFAIIGLTSFLIVYRYGWREGIIKSIQHKASQKVQNGEGHLSSPEFINLLEIGKESEEGIDRGIVLDALASLTGQICSHKAYKGDSLSLLIDSLVKMLATHPDAEDIPNYQKAVEILTTILASGGTREGNGLVDQQHAVRALSVLGQTFLAEINISVETDHVLMNYEEALGLAVSRHPSLLTDVTQSLTEVGAVALEYRHYLFAVATLERLFTINEEVSGYLEEAMADLLGLMAHFWEGGESSREFVQTRIPRVKRCIKGTLLHALEKARIHAQMTMRFDTADKLSQMKKDLARKR